MISFDYQCLSCGDEKTNTEMESFACICGGSYKLVDTTLKSGTNFEPHYSPEIKQMVYSWKDAEKKGKAFRSADHPNGFILTQSNRRFIDECKNIKKHREDFIQQSYSKGEMKKGIDGVWRRDQGLKYKPGSKVRLDEKTRTFVPVNR